MKGYTNPDNPAALKLQLAAEFGDKELHLKIVPDEELSNYQSLPVVHFGKEIIFSSTVAAKFLFPPHSSVCDKVCLWLEWETTRLQVYLVNNGFSKNKDDNFVSLMNTLDLGLQNSNFIIGNDISVADLAIWSSLFPVITESSLKDQYFITNKNILNWFNILSDHHKVKETVLKWSNKTGLVTLNAFISKYCYHVPTVDIRSSVQNSVKNQVKTIIETKTDYLVSTEELDLVKKSWLNDPALRAKPKSFSKPVLPKENEKNVLITSALPYVNNVPHLGNIIGCVLSADVFARYCRLRNWNTLYICGTDEYGTATETKALEENLTPQQICDKYFKMHEDTYKWFNISFDYFGRTTTFLQKRITQDLFMQVYKNGYTSVNSIEQLLCESCNRYLADRFVEGICPNCKYEDARGDQCDSCGHLINAVELIEPRCKICGSEPVIRNSDQIFLELPKIEPTLRKWLKESSPNWSSNARLITNSWLKSGLKSRCITRDLKWGTPVPLPGFEQKVFYVWFDAPIGYLSITANYTAEWKKWWQPSPRTLVSYYEFMAKDNVPFHSVMFPATIFAINQNFLLVNHIMATEYLNYEDGKFSKSRGIGVFGTDAKETGLSADAFRFYLLYIRPESQDSSFSWIDFETKHNSELLNNIGNFVNRALMFTEKYFSSIIPDMNLLLEDYHVLAMITRDIISYNKSVENGKLRDGIRHILNISKIGNQYMQANAPWKLIKGTSEEKCRSGTVIGLSCNIAAQLMIMLQPYMPDTSKIIAGQLNAPADIFVLTDKMNMLLSPGHKIGKPTPLFTKIESGMVEQFKKKFSGLRKSPSPDNSVKSSATRNNRSNTLLSLDVQAINEIEKAISEQSDTVHSLEKFGTDQPQYQLNSNILMDMVKSLEHLTAASTNGTIASTSSSNNKFADHKEELVIALEKLVSNQANTVREMKSDGNPRSEWQPQVDLLLSLKNQLAKAKGSEVPSVGSSGKKKKGRK